MKKIYLLAAAAALFAACSSDKDSLETQQQPAQLEEGAVGFDAYTQRAITRGGWPGSLITSTLQGFGGLDPKGGFGVFGYYTDNNEYDQRSTPNFFYNQLVYWDGGSWSYEPVKYWPNEYGSNAVSEDQDKVTYFAYAPWVDVVPTSGKLAVTDYQAEEWGITGMTRNSNQGDPILKYIATFSTNRSVDLCWGVADYNDGIWPITKDGGSQNIANGTPWLNVERPASTDQRVKFTFKHALAQLRVNIDAVVDVNDNQPAGNADPMTRIWVREVTFKGFTMKGSLNLDNGDEKYSPKWLDYGGQNELVAEGVTIYDGRKDGKEGVNGAVATNEKVTGLNPILVQDGVYAGKDWTTATPPVLDAADQTVYNGSGLHVYGVDANGAPKNGEANYDRAGVTATTVPLFDQYAKEGPDNKNFTVTSADQLVNYPFHVIPTDEDFEVEIVYDVETVSENLAQNLSDGQTKGTSIENRITKTVSFGTSSGNKVTRLQAGNSYELNLHLGLASVKVDATVSEWIDVKPIDVDLPLNAPAFEAKADPATSTDYSVTLPYTGNYTFAITGLDGGESVKNTYTSDEPTTSNKHSFAPNGADDKWVFSATSANTSGVALQVVSPFMNQGTTNRNVEVTWTGVQSEKGAKITFTQQAHPLELAIKKAKDNQITLVRSGDFETTDDWFVDGIIPGHTANIRVWRNGTELIKTTASAPGTGEFLFPATSPTPTKTEATILLADGLKSGDIVRVELTTGDAPTETAEGGQFGFYPTSVTIPFRESEVYSYKPKYANGDVTYAIKDGAATNVLSGLSSTEGLCTFKTAKAGETVIVGDYLGEKSELAVKVEKQNMEIVDFTATGITDGKISVPQSEIGPSGKDITTLSATSRGVLDKDVTSTVNYSLVAKDAAGNNVNDPSAHIYLVSGSHIKLLDLTSGVYTITVTASAEVPSGKGECYKTPTSVQKIITLTVTAP